jgi:lysophospholipase L1-like esterase
MRPERPIRWQLPTMLGAAMLPFLVAPALVGGAASAPEAILGGDALSAADGTDGNAAGEEPCLAPAIEDDASAQLVKVSRADPAAEGAEARVLRAFAKAVKAPGAVLEEPCAQVTTGDVCGCERGALEPFWASLDRARARGARSGIVVFGNSLIASDGIINVVRRRLVERFGDAGPGLLLADRMASYGPRDRTARAASGYRAETMASEGDRTIPFGLAGVHHVSEGPASSRFSLVENAGVTLFWLDRAEGPQLSFRVEGGAWVPIERRGDGAARITPLDLASSMAEGAGSPSWLEVRAPKAGAVIQGLTIEGQGHVRSGPTGSGGIVLDTLGVPSADATLWLKTDEQIFQRQLRARDPALVVVMLGGNETRRLSWARSTRAQIERDLRGLLARAHEGLPAPERAACLVIGPIDAVQGAEAEDPFTPRSLLRDVVAIERQVALEEGCAFFDLYAAMGGRGSLQRFHAADALHDDLNHPRGKGLDVLGQLIADALLDGYAASHPPRGDAAPPLVARGS